MSRPRAGRGVGNQDPLTAAREAFDHRAGRDAYDHLRDAAEGRDLEPEDLRRLAMSAYLTGQNEAAEEGLERLHHVLFDDGQVDRAARWATLAGDHAVQRDPRTLNRGVPVVEPVRGSPIPAHEEAAMSLLMDL